MPSSERFPCRKSVSWRMLDPEALVLDTKRGTLYPLNSVAARIWQLCDGGRSVEEIVQVITAEFDADQATIRRDAEEFFDQLVAAELISIDARPAGKPGGGG